VAACATSGAEDAWAEFIRRFHPLIARVVVRVCRKWGESSPEVMDDLIQETYLKLCADRLRALGTFRSIHRDAVFGYIRVFTANLVHDHFKAERRLKRGGTLTVPLEDEETIEKEKQTTKAGSAEAVERSVLLNEIDAFLRRGAGTDAPRDRRIFWLYYRVGLTAAQIAAAPGVELGTKGVETVLLRVTRTIREHLVEGTERKSKSDASREGIRPAEAL